MEVALFNGLRFLEGIGLDAVEEHPAFYISGAGCVWL